LLELATDSFLATHRSICVPRSGIKQEVLRAVDTSKGAADLMAQFARLANHCLVITDSERRLTWANDVFSLMCGYSPSELKGNNPGRLLQGELTDSASTKRIRRALDKLQVVSEELVNYHKNGRPYWVRLTISPVIDAEGKARGFFALGNEIKDRRIPR
jgi:PAS domain S-box-containing protein